jgi:hypothetical protein
VAEKARKLLAWLAKKHPVAGTEIEPRVFKLDKLIKRLANVQGNEFQPDAEADRELVEALPWLSAAWVQGEAELRFVIFDYLADSLGFIDGAPEKMGSGGWYVSPLKISAAGWEQLQSFGLSDANTGFVAMWFAPEMTAIWEAAFYPAIRDAGYEPLRIDKREHNNKIDDEIIASIRGARFVVADFTGGRGGVYFEAGFAAGLGKPVIWTARADWIAQLHFDTRQFNHIRWSDDDPDSFRAALQHRVEATIGRGARRVE